MHKGQNPFNLALLNFCTATRCDFKESNKGGLVLNAKLIKQCGNVYGAELEMNPWMVSSFAGKDSIPEVE